MRGKTKKKETFFFFQYKQTHFKTIPKTSAPNALCSWAHRRFPSEKLRGFETKSLLFASAPRQRLIVGNSVFELQAHFHYYCSIAFYWGSINILTDISIINLRLFHLDKYLRTYVKCMLTLFLFFAWESSVRPWA